MINPISSKTLVIVAFASIVLTAVLPGVAEARKGLATIGGGNPVSCTDTIRNVSLTSGGSRAKDQIGLGPDSMHVFVEFMWRPCTSPLERMDVTVVDHATGETQFVAQGAGTYPVGYDLKWTAYTSNALFGHAYDITIRTSNPVTGATIGTWTGSILTGSKL